MVHTAHVWARTLLFSTLHAPGTNVNISQSVKLIIVCRSRIWTANPAGGIVTATLNFKKLLECVSTVPFGAPDDEGRKMEVFKGATP